MLKARLLAVGLGVLTVFSQSGFAADEIAARRPYCPCPPGYVRPVCPPGHPGHIPSAPVPSTPSDVHPNDLPSDDDPNKPDTPAPTPDTPPADPGAQFPPADPGAQAPPVAPSSGGPSMGTGLAGSSGGATTPMLGRLDASNRLNIFDNQTAIPRSRVWFAYQNAEGIDSGIQNFEGLNGIANYNVYRLGLELAITNDFSMSVQGQYVNPYDAGDGAQLEEDWTDPQFLAKYVVYRDTNCCGHMTVVSATLGMQVETSNDPLVLDNDSNRIYPGVLFYKDHNDKYFTQGGAQFGISTERDPVTFDWSYSAGYWAYKHPLVDGQCCCDAPFIIGVAPQIGILGKHVYGDNDVDNPFRLGADTSFALTGLAGTARLEEARHVLDVTAGATILMQGNTAVGVGYSLPITNAEQRRGEFIASLNWYF